MNLPSDAPLSIAGRTGVSGGVTKAVRPVRSRWRRWIVILFGTPLVSYLLLVVSLIMFENSLIYFPSVYPHGHWNLPEATFEDAWFTAADGTKLHGWYLPHPQPRATLLFAHGNAGNLSHRHEIISDLVDRLGVSVMIFDYRGYGRSEGAPSESGILADARAARQWLAGRADIAPDDIVLIGESLGGGVMVDLAAEDGARGLILENTFSSLPEVAAFHYRWVPVKLLMRTQLNSAAKITRYHGPLLQFHGDADSVIPFEIGERLFKAANEPKQLVVIRGGDHNDPQTPQYFAAIDEFLDRLP